MSVTDGAPAGGTPLGPAPRVVILDHGSGNLRSAERALTRAGADTVVTADLAAAAQADGLVVPGVGAFAACMEGIRAIGAGPVIAERVRTGRPVLGICVGMQILYDYGMEDPLAAARTAHPPGACTDGVPEPDTDTAPGTGVRTAGLGLLPGGVVRLRADRIPHMGWNTVEAPAGSALFAGIPPGTRFYFVHSYAAPPTGAPGSLEALTRHDDDFVAAVERGSLWATQFHPEKSGDAGAALLRTWVGTLRGTR